jgi:microcin C transport system substrate-binding protein
MRRPISASRSTRPISPHLDYVNPEAPKGGEISFWSQGNFDSFNIYTRRGVAGALTTVMYESILANTADDAYGIYCYLCTTMEFPESRDWVIFNLRDDVTFSDGSPMTAEDIAFTFDLFIEQGITEYRTVVEGFVEAVEVLGPHRIKFTFTDEAPRRDVLSFAGGTTVFSKAWFEETGARIDESTLTPFLGTGPYVVESFDVGRQIVYGRNPNFWGADHPLNVGQNNFDRMRVEYFADSSAALEAFKAGIYTFRNENSSRDWATGYDFPAVAAGPGEGRGTARRHHRVGPGLRVQPAQARMAGPATCARPCG